MPVRPAGAFESPPAAGLCSIMNPPVKPQHLVVEGLTTTTYWGMPGGMFGWRKSKGRAKVAPETLQEQIDALEGKFRSLMLEWTDTYDKLYRLAGRMDASRRWSGEKSPPQATEGKEIVPENGPEGVFPDAQETPPTTRAQTRKDLLALWKS